jgi:hypothetical protein
MKENELDAVSADEHLIGEDIVMQQTKQVLIHGLKDGGIIIPQHSLQPVGSLCICRLSHLTRHRHRQNHCG